MQYYNYLFFFFAYGFLGWCVEVAYATIKLNKFVNRGFLNGPICPIYGFGVVSVIFFLTPLSNRIFILYIAATVLVTAVEGVTGFLMDVIFHHRWWDYSDKPLNIGGYVCLLFSLLWGAVCVFIVRVFQPGLAKVISVLPISMGVSMLCVFVIALFIDLFVTVAEVLKLNHQLDMLEMMAGELRELSEKLGESIHENVMDGIGMKDRIEDAVEEMEIKERIADVTEDGKAMMEQKVAELREKYEELSRHGSRVTKRLVKAFPKLESKRHYEMLEQMKARIMEFRK